MISFICLLLLSLTHAASPPCSELDYESTYTVGQRCESRDSSGKVLGTFEYLEDPQFGPAWQGDDGVQWSATAYTLNLEYMTTNENLGSTLPINDLVQDSVPIRKCKALGGDLPTYEDFRKLMSQFEMRATYKRDELTDLGQSHLSALWKHDRYDDGYIAFWTRSMHWFANKQVWAYTGGALYSVPQNRKAFTRCLRLPKEGR